MIVAVQGESVQSLETRLGAKSLPDPSSSETRQCGREWRSHVVRLTGRIRLSMTLIRFRSVHHRDCSEAFFRPPRSWGLEMHVDPTPLITRKATVLTAIFRQRHPRTCLWYSYEYACASGGDPPVAFSWFKTVVTAGF